MEIFEGYRALFRPLKRPTITIGNFDGVHLGHRALLQAARARAEHDEGDAVAFTFEPHPVAYLAPDRAPPRLSSPERKQELLAQAGMDVIIIQPFDAELAMLSAEEFHTTVLRDVLGCRHLVVGHDFRYGQGRRGTIDSLRSAGSALGYSVEVVEPVEVDGTRVSSSQIRELLLAGRVEAARRALGRDYDVDGSVVRGAGRGRAFGIPTANVRTSGLLLPAPGIYATWLEILEGGAPRRFMGATSLGTNPTFVEGGALSLEVHVLDFDGDLYDRSVRVCFVEHLRPEERYDTTEALLRQIHDDIRRTRAILNQAPALSVR